MCLKGRIMYKKSLFLLWIMIMFCLLSPGVKMYVQSPKQGQESGKIRIASCQFSISFNNNALRK